VSVFSGQVSQLAFATGQAVNDLSQRFGLCQLTKHHSYELAPAAKAFGMAFGIQAPNLSRKMMPIHQAKKLAKEASLLYLKLPKSIPSVHGPAWRPWARSQRKGILKNNGYIRYDTSLNH
jgi:hypothetical protein